MSEPFRWRRLAPVAALAAATAVSAAAALGMTGVRVAVTPALSVEDEPVHIAVDGLASAQLVTVAVSSVDSKGVPWTSSTTFRADHAGIVDVDRAAPVAGSYEGAWGMGPIAMMRATKPDPAGAYFWDGTHAQTFIVTVRSHGRELASTTFRRRFSARPVRLEHQTLRGHGFYGEYWAPTVSGRRPAILAIGGSDGGDLGMYLVSALLAAHGFPTLDIAYFDEPGLPQSLSSIPLEYFARALDWLRAQPHVDASRVVALGASRGSEAALLLGVHYPTLVRAVIGSVPSNVALCSYPGCEGPAWTLHGKALPYTREFNQPHPLDDPAAVIPAERIRGPILLDCAGQDRVWDSCPFAQAIVQRLRSHHDTNAHLLYRAPDAGHLVGGLLPYEPVAGGADPTDELARERLWPHVLAFLTAIARAPH
jgi:dienelactone hydrolase